MDGAVECTHCRVVMTSWSAPGSPVRYWQCPFCGRTHSSLYGEVFRRRAGARKVEALPRARAAVAVPSASPDDVRWARVRASAARWFARLEADEARNVVHPRSVNPAAAQDGVPEADPRDVVLIGLGKLRKGR